MRKSKIEIEFEIVLLDHQIEKLAMNGINTEALQIRLKHLRTLSDQFRSKFYDEFEECSVTGNESLF